MFVFKLSCMQNLYMGYILSYKGYAICELQKNNKYTRHISEHSHGVVPFENFSIHRFSYSCA